MMNSSYLRKNKLEIFQIGTIFFIILIAKILTTEIIEFRYVNKFYQESSSFLAFITKSKTFLVLIVTAIAITLILNYYSGKVKLHLLEKSILFTSLFLIWLNTVFIPHNWYFNQFHLFDKLFLTALFVLSIFRPSFSLLFWLFSLLFIKQLQFPRVFYYTFTDKQIFYEIILMTALWIPLKKLLNIQKEYFFVGVFGVFATWYFLAGLGKLEIGWWNNKAYNLYLSSLPYQWLYGWPKLKELLFRFLYNFNDLLVLLTLFAELGVIFFFLNRKYAIFLICLLFGMHFFIFIASGVFFWKWMVFLLIILLAIFKGWVANSVFNVYNFFISNLIFLIFGIMMNGTKLSWIDTGVVNFHSINLKSDSFDYRLDASFFAPYDVIFAQNRFFFLEEKPLISNTYGGSYNAKIGLKVTEVSNEDLKNFINENGFIYRNHESDSSFQEFVKTFVRNKLLDGSLKPPFYSPNHIYQGPNQKDFSIETKDFFIEIQFFEIKVNSPFKLDTLTYSKRILSNSN